MSRWRLAVHAMLGYTLALLTVALLVIALRLLGFAHAAVLAGVIGLPVGALVGLAVDLWRAG